MFWNGGIFLAWFSVLFIRVCTWEKTHFLKSAVPLTSQITIPMLTALPYQLIPLLTFFPITLATPHKTIYFFSFLSFFFFFLEQELFISLYLLFRFWICCMISWLLCSRVCRSSDKWVIHHLGVFRCWLWCWYYRSQRLLKVKPYEMFGIQTVLSAEEEFCELVY